MTVQAAILSLLQRIDPTMKDMTVVTAANIATWNTSGGDKFDSQRICDLWNQARFLLTQVLHEQMSLEQLSKEVAGNLVTNSAFQFASGSATLPTGYVFPVSLWDVSGNIITILPFGMMNTVKHGALESATNRFVFEAGTTLVTISTSTYVTDASTYVLRYYGITTFTTTDVTGGSTVESFRERWIPVLLEIASKLALEQGTADAEAIARAFVGGAK